MSFYYHWFVKNTHVGDPPILNNQFGVLESVCPAASFDWFSTLSSQQRKEPEAIQEYCAYFPQIFQRDSHTAHQVRIIQELDIDFGRLDILVELGDLSNFFEQEFGISIGRGNKSGRPVIVPEFVQLMCRTLYAIDYDLLRKE